ncbi:hypothetical protein GOV13_02420 [Candidatus Pacearchaeota archaeon]|nr:hypothetical protein [Candidatus Pacearchaeota archaeon]
MAEKDTIFSSEIKSKGFFNFKEFYKFCYEWIDDEINIEMSEKKYEEKLSGDSKEIIIEWEEARKFSDYFKFEMKVEFVVRNMKDVEINQGGKKVKINSGDLKVKVKGILVKDYDGKFETSAFNKFLRSIYEKWVITARIEQFEDKIVGDCDKFLAQAKAYLVLEGKR